jgi:hypothetical protein
MIEDWFFILFTGIEIGRNSSRITRRTRFYSCIQLVISQNKWTTSKSDRIDMSYFMIYLNKRQVSIYLIYSDDVWYVLIIFDICWWYLMYLRLYLVFVDYTWWCLMIFDDVWSYLMIPWYIFWYIQWKFQDPKLEVLYHIRPYFVGIFPYIGLIYGRYLQFRILKWPLNIWGVLKSWMIPMSGFQFY